MSTRYTLYLFEFFYFHVYGMSSAVWSEKRVVEAPIIIVNVKSSKFRWSMTKVTLCVKNGGVVSPHKIMIDS